MTNKVCGQHKYQHETDHKSLDPNPPHHWKNKLMKEAEETHRDPSQIKNQASFWKRIKIKKKRKKKLLETTKRPKLETWSRWGHIERPDNFFSNIDFFFPLISNIKSFTGTKYILTTSCRNWKACVGLFFFFFKSHPVFKKKKRFWLNRGTTVGMIQITSRCTHFGFHQDKTKHPPNYGWNMNKVEEIIRQERNTGKVFFLLSFGSGQ